ncbi:MAG: hypothetical protein ACKOW9_00440 [Candidatus Paceibacterota bacterium]
MLQGDMRLIIPLQGGHIYLLDPANGHNIHLKLGSERAAAELARVSSLGYAEKLTNELNALSKKYPEDDWASAKTAVKLV